MPLAEAPKAPPKKPARHRAPVVRQSQSAITDAREQALNGFGQIIAFGCVMRGNFADAGAIAEYGPPISHEIAVIGQDNPQVAHWLDYLTASGPYAKVIALALPFGLQLAVNHGKLEAKQVAALGIVEPEELASNARANADKMAETKADLSAVPEAS